MKKLSTVCLIAFAATFITSCASTTRRTNCRGNGSWSGNRNLGAINQTKKQDQQKYFAFETIKETEIENN